MKSLSSQRQPSCDVIISAPLFVRSPLSSYSLPAPLLGQPTAIPSSPSDSQHTNTKHICFFKTAYPTNTQTPYMFLQRTYHNISQHITHKHTTIVPSKHITTYQTYHVLYPSGIFFVIKIQTVVFISSHQK